MAVLKAREIDRFVSNPDFSCRVFLIYGPDTGLVRERAGKLSRAFVADPSDPFSVVRIDADEAASDPARIAEEAHSVGMFSGDRVIRIAGTTRKDLAKAVLPVLEVPPGDAIVIVEAGDLKKTSGLRKLAEGHKHALCIPCYADDAQGLASLIEGCVAEAGMTIEADAKAALARLLGADRQVSRSEIEKLLLYCHGRDRIVLEDVQLSVGDASHSVLDQIADACAQGDLKALTEEMPKAIASGTRPDMVLFAVLRQFQTLHAARCRMQSERKSASAIVDTMRPPVHFKRKAVVVKVLGRWEPAQMAVALTRLNDAMLNARTSQANAMSIASAALYWIALQGAKSGQSAA